MLDARLIEQEFGYMKGHVYLNSSLVGMPPERVKDACRVFMDEYVATFNESIKSDLLAKRVVAKENFAKLINCSPDDINFQKNATEANATFAMGYAELKPGTNAIIVDSDFPNTIFPWINAHKQRGFELKVYKTTRGQIPADEIIAMMDENTKVVALAAVQSGWGYFADLKAIGTECRKRGIAFAVDAFQGLGRVNIDVQDCCIDYLVCGGFKALMGTWGASFVYCRQETALKLFPPTAGYQGVKSHNLAPKVTTEFDELDFYDSIRRIEAGGQCTYAIHATSKGIELIHELGKNNVEKHVLRLEAYLRAKLASLPLDVITPDDPARCSGMVVLLYPEELTERAKELFKKYVIHATMRNGYIRMTIALFNTQEDMDIVYQALSELCREIKG